MEATQSLTRSASNVDTTYGTTESSVSAVSWPAVFAGAFVASSVTLILVFLGSGIGVSITSFRGDAGAGATSIAVLTVVWLVVVQWIASGLGGYLTGRLRTKWVGTHTHEVFFRDTAHGFLSWAVATCALTALLASITSNTLSTGATMATSATAPAVSSAQSGAADLQGYEIDRLLRGNQPGSEMTPAETHAEVARIVAVGLVNGDITPGDRQYLTQLVSSRDGISSSDAQQRVDSMIAQVKTDRANAQEALAKAKKATSTLAIITALSMMIGAFTASAAAAFGGSQRDEHP